MDKYLLPGETIQFMGENQPLVGLVNIIIRGNVGYIKFRLEPGRGHPDIFGKVAAHLVLEGFDNSLYAGAGVKDIIHDEQPVFPVGLFDDVLQPVDADLFSLFLIPR